MNMKVNIVMDFAKMLASEFNNDRQTNIRTEDKKLLQYNVHGLAFR